MTKAELEQYQDICGELAELEQRLAGARQRTPACAVALSAVLGERRQELFRRKAEIEAFASSLPWGKRQLVRAVMRHGHRWDVVRWEIQSYKSPDAVRKEYERIFKKF